ncbi:MAG: Fe-S cluster assembly protein SufD [Limosilactobacillus oris]|jgi:Fe-S cluster assembly protein SufD|uniref:Fe-S cluster assembly protein SufD n=1 Tax=Limosilactobacillus oris TaxID=1632 RepID=UPI001747FD1F|nr:Fe-S cluster assembly protein SufD [Limosilactobacillus oris]MCH3910382.1 Fe-S cluster assembly protein SufD [Limosilactobacillus oris]MCH3939508.1 Fe-S cluster assembly protein SufD [Limosilactobacillus oris]MCI1980922.1 Fe-S cluster assembly protein SufD [Limosilactobacillus oris]HJF47745.1 Fe-S cluster assembly protein SufD [Limosilactobacillus oris]
MTDLAEAKQQLTVASQQNEEPASLLDRRLAARDLMAQLRLPRMQRFNFRDWPLIADQPLEWVSSDTDLEKIAPDDEVIRVTQVGQTTVKVHIPERLRAAGVVLTDIFTAARQYPEMFEKYFMSAIKTDENLLTAYHVAYLNAGLFLYVPKNVEIEKPIEAELVQDNTQGQPLISHILVVADRGSKVKFIQHLTTVGDQANPANMMIELIARDNSEIDFSSLDELGAQTHTYFKRRADIGRDAHVEWAVGLMNDGNTVGDMDSELLGEGGYANSKMIAVTTRKQEVGVNNRVTNHGKHTTGLINQRGVILENSELIFNGIGQIIHGAHGSKADQQNRVLIMSDQARGDANPILLIDENDVEAGHAASVGPVDPHQMYYLMSRGIPRKQAERMVIRGFLGAVLSAIPAADVRNKLVEILERKLTDGQQYQ